MCTLNPLHCSVSMTSVSLLSQHYKTLGIFTIKCVSDDIDQTIVLILWAMFKEKYSEYYTLIIYNA